MTIVEIISFMKPNFFIDLEGGSYACALGQKSGLLFTAFQHEFGEANVHEGKSGTLEVAVPQGKKPEDFISLLPTMGFHLESAFRDTSEEDFPTDHWTLVSIGSGGIGSV